MERVDVLSEYSRRRLAASERNDTYSRMRALFNNDYYTWWDNHFYKEDRVNVVLNYVRPIVKKGSSFLVGDAPEFAVSPLGNKPRQLAASSKAERILYGLLRKSNFSRVLLRVAQDSALLGTGWMKTYVETDASGKPKVPRVSYVRPEYIYPSGYQSIHDERIYDVIYAYQMRLEQARAEYGKDVGPDSPLDETGEKDSSSPLDVATYIEYWSEKEYILIVGSKVVEKMENPYGFIPFVPFPWFSIPGSILGYGLVEDITGPNILLNVLESRRADAAIMHCNPPLKFKNARITSRQDFLSDMDGNVHFLPPDSDLDYLTWPGEPPTIEDSRRSLKNYIHDASYIPEHAFSSGQVLTGMAWRMGLDPMVKMIHEVRCNWDVSLKDVCCHLLELTAKYFAEKDMSEIIYISPSGKRGDELKGADAAGGRDVEVIWRDVMPRDDVTMARFELEKLSANVQSVWTTMERLGIPQPDEEMERMKAEFGEPAFRPRERAMQQTSDAKALLALAKAAQMGEEGAAGVSPAEGFGPMQEREALVPGEPGRPPENTAIGPTPEQEAQSLAYPEAGGR